MMITDVDFCDNPYVAAQGAAAVVIVTEWDALRALDLPRLKGVMSGDGLVDLRNIYRPADAEAPALSMSALVAVPLPK